MTILHGNTLDVALLRDLLEGCAHGPHQVRHRAVRAARRRVVEELANSLKTKVGKNDVINQLYCVPSKTTLRKTNKKQHRLPRVSVSVPVNLPGPPCMVLTDSLICTKNG